MGFHNVRFPASQSFGSIGGPERRTEIVTLANGFEERNTPWAHSRRRYNAGLGLRSLDDIADLVAFFEARQGQLFGFRWKDWSDYKTCKPSEKVDFEDQDIAQGDGVTTIFQLNKTYASGSASYVRPLAKPVFGSVRAGVHGIELQEGIDWSVDTTTGYITFVSPPGDGLPVSAGCEFDVPVRFDTSNISTSVSSFQAGEIPDVPVVEVRVQ